MSEQAQRGGQSKLADVQPGGRVRLGDQPWPAIDAILADAYSAGATGLPFEGIARRHAVRAAVAALSAQLSPGGQGNAVTPAMVDAAAGVLARWAGHDDGSRWVHEARDALEAALAARQPVEAAPQGCDACDRTGIRQNDEGRNICCPDCDLGSACAGDTRQPVGCSFQAGVARWMGQCFLPSLYSNMTERGDRLLEEVLELLQAHGYDKARVPTLVDYVFGRSVGDPAQEVGGVMVTLAGYCWVAVLDMHAAGDAELARISRPEVMAKIQAKQEAKNALHFDTPLPGNAGPTAQASDLAPITIPDTPEVRDILGRPNFWCSPWANVLRMRGDEIPNKAEEEQAAVIRFMLNHYLANGADWAETAGAELDAIRKADSQAVGNG